jgi:hypothetical protein
MSVNDVVRGTVTSARIQETKRLLLELNAGEQHTPERAPLPDESRATLRLRASDVEATVWEWK